MCLTWIRTFSMKEGEILDLDVQQETQVQIEDLDLDLDGRQDATLPDIDAYDREGDLEEAECEDWSKPTPMFPAYFARLESFRSSRITGPVNLLPYDATLLEYFYF
ncbi:hypothetical protein RRG08_030370 [Elysia crispata]|uniref:Uncharacterized protein n=1 Tax=Elysia crispata TaxID=231223 RepID=A0AAE0YG03_9GAST|nr:hypothetical protein RRG08_030370 [Elysia crispata]